VTSFTSIIIKKIQTPESTICKSGRRDLSREPQDMDSNMGSVGHRLFPALDVLALGMVDVWVGRVLPGNKQAWTHFDSCAKL
jgi:hypothetical protein